MRPHRGTAAECGLAPRHAVRRRAIETLAGLVVSLSVFPAAEVLAVETKAGTLPGTRVAEGEITQWAVPTNLAARDPAIDSRGNVFFAVARGDRIARFDPAKEQFTEWKLPEGVKPHGVVVASDGIVFFGGNGNGTIGELDPATGSVRLHRTSDPASGVYSLASDADGNIWFTERSAGRIGRLNRASGIIATYPMGGEPYGIVQDKRGLIWVTRIAADRLGCFDPRTGEMTEIITGAGSRPRRLSVAPDGMLWVSYYGTGKVAQVDPVRRMVVKEFDLPGGTNAGPYSVTVDAAGLVWVSLFKTDSVALLDPKTGKVSVFVIPDKMSGIRNATVDQLGRLWYLAMATGKLGMIR